MLNEGVLQIALGLARRQLFYYRRRRAQTFRGTELVLLFERENWVQFSRNSLLFKAPKIVFLELKWAIDDQRLRNRTTLRVSTPDFFWILPGFVSVLSILLLMDFVWKPDESKPVSSKGLQSSHNNVQVFTWFHIKFKIKIIFETRSHFERVF